MLNELTYCICFIIVTMSIQSFVHDSLLLVMRKHLFEIFQKEFDSEIRKKSCFLTITLVFLIYVADLHLHYIVKPVKYTKFLEIFRRSVLSESGE